MKRPDPRPATLKSGRSSVGHPVDVATGNLFHLEEDHVQPGRMPLILGRRYSGELIAREAGIYGPGWASSLEVRLRRDLDGFLFIGEDGETEVAFDDPDGSLEQGSVLKNPGAFHELRQAGHDFLVTRWDPESDEVVLYRFHEGTDGAWWPLASREDPAGQGFDLRHDAQGRPTIVRQRREKRAYRLIYQGARLVEVRLTAELNERTVMRYGYDRDQRLSSATDALGYQSRYEYDAAGRLIREVTPSGMVYHFRYDARGRCVENGGLDGFGRYTLKIEAAAHITQAADPLGHETLYEWNDAFQVVREISPLGRVTASTYDEDGRLIEKIEPGGRTTTYRFDERGDRVEEASPGGAARSFEYNDRHQVVAVVDPLGNRWEREFDACHRAKEVRDPSGAAYRFEYDAQGDLAFVIDPLGHRRSFGHNEAGDLIFSTDWKGNTTRYEHDWEGRLIALTDALEKRTSMMLDANGRMREVYLPDGAKRRYGWNVYDDLTEFVDELGAVTRNRYSPCGYLVESIRPDGARTSLEWGVVPSQLLSVTNARGEVYRFTWNSDGQLEREQDFAGRETLYFYGPDARVSETLNAAAQRTKLEHDLDGHLTKLAFDDGTGCVFAWDLRGLLLKADNGQCPIEREYDSIGRMVLERQGEHTLRNTFDPAGNRTHRSSSLGHETSFLWDPNGQLEWLELPGVAPLHFAYNPLQQEIARTLVAGVRIQREYDVRDRLSAHTLSTDPGGRSGRSEAGGPGSPLRRYVYDAASNLTSILEADGRTARYTYDTVGRILEAVLPSGRVESFAYDSTDNLVHHALGRLSTDPASGAPARAMAHGVDSKILQYGPGDTLEQRGDTRYEHDRLGQLVARVSPTGTTRFYWNRMGQLERAVLADGTEWRYRYDALSRRVEKRGPDKQTGFVWDGDVVLHERRIAADGSSTTVHWEYEDESFAPLARAQGQDLAICATDQVGVPREWLEPGGRVVWKAEFSTWGELERNEIAEIDCPVRFQGQWWDEETGLHYNRFRYYEADTGRYVSTDPIGLQGSENCYQYVPNPMGWFDPLGLTADAPRHDTSNQARREVMRKAGIPTSQQPISRSRNSSGYEYTYAVPQPGGGTALVSVQQQTMDRSHPGDPHWEAGRVKVRDGSVQMNRHGRPKLENEGKQKENYEC